MFVSIKDRQLTVIIAMCLVVMVVGAYVRISEAGLACPDWPLCHGQLVPTFTNKIFWEWGHRLLALLTFLLVVRFVIVNWQEVRARRLYLVATLILFIWQVLLGALTVSELLNPKIVNLHFLSALMLLSMFICYRLSYRLPNKYSPAVVGWFGRWFLPMMTLLIIGQMVLGGIVSANYSGYACPNFPSCDGNWQIPDNPSQLWHMIHRLFSLVLVLASVGFLILPRQRQLANGARLACRYVPCLLIMQIVIGIVAVTHELATGLRLAHFVNGLAIYILAFNATCEDWLLRRRS